MQARGAHGLAVNSMLHRRRSAVHPTHWPGCSLSLLPELREKAGNDARTRVRASRFVKAVAEAGVIVQVIAVFNTLSRRTVLSRCNTALSARGAALRSAALRRAGAARRCSALLGATRRWACAWASAARRPTLIRESVLRVRPFVEKYCHCSEKYSQERAGEIRVRAVRRRLTHP